MPVIAIVNRKGGSGKSTIATHIAAYCAHKGIPVMLGDVDRQQSTRSWLKLRQIHHPEAPAIMGWLVNQSSGLKPPSGVSHVVLDTPGGLHGLDLARVVMFADAILMPVCNSVFDRDSADQCLEELKLLPRISSGRCKLGMIGMRIDPQTLDAASLTQWAEARKLEFTGSIRQAPNYVQCIERGITLFDLPSAAVAPDLQQWDSILNWLQPVLYPEQTLLATTAPRLVPRNTPMPSLSPNYGNGQASASPNNPSSGISPPLSTSRYIPPPLTAPARGGLFDGFGLPNFLRRK